MKNNFTILAIAIVCAFLIGFSLGYQLAKKEAPVIEKIEIIPEQKPIQETLILVHRDHEMKKGQFVYISGILNEYLIVKKLEAENFPHPETPIYIVHSFHNHFYMYIKSICYD